MNDTSSPQNPWAFIRTCNEIKTIKQSLQSIVGAIHRGIIVYHECTDGSDEIIKEFCSEHKGFICAEYPHEVKKCHYKKSVDGHKKTLAEYYNFALSFIPQGEWLVKIDLDHIYDTQRLKNSFKHAYTVNDIICFPRINLHYSDGKIFINKNEPAVLPYDHWLVYNDNLSFINKIQSDDGENVRYWEYLEIPNRKVKRFKGCRLNNWHFPLMKDRRIHWFNDDNHILLSEFKKTMDPSFKRKYGISDDMLDEDRIIKALKL